MTSGQTLTDTERTDWLRLARSENVGPITFDRLVRQFGSAGEALEALPGLARRGGSAGPLRICPRDQAERELERLTNLDCQLVARCEPAYPAALAAADAAPPVLTVCGSTDVLTRPAVAIVGSRNASAVGCRLARELARGLGEGGFVVVSGLARGIDAAAHEASVEYGTIAAMAGGIDRPYPPENIPLLETICQSGSGAAVTEMPLGWEPRARDFPRRNRIIAGIGLGLVVVEAAHKSGSLISARIAGELGRIVFAVPGSPMDPRAAGTNTLIRDGAILTASADDILQTLAPLAGDPKPPSTPDLFREDSKAVLPKVTATTSDQHRQISDALGAAPTALDDLVRHTGLAPPQVHAVLLELDLAGRLARHPDGCVSLVPGQPN